MAMGDDKTKKGIRHKAIVDLENVKHPSSIKLIPVAIKKNQDSEGRTENSASGLTMRELNEFINDPFWIRMRQALLCMTILLFLTIFLVSVLIIVYAPGCEFKSMPHKNMRRTRECKTDEECAAIQNTSCMSDPRDYKMRCLCRDSSAPINGACPNRPRAVGSPCKTDSECIDGSECKSMNITITSFKTCQCREGYMSRDGYCSDAMNLQVPSVVTVLGFSLARLMMRNLGISF